MSMHLSGAVVEQLMLKQWFFKITGFAQDLLSDVDALEWPERVKLMQRNWIGKSEGLYIDFQIQNSDEKITIFTTRPETLFGVTFVALAHNHPKAELAKANGLVHPLTSLLIPVLTADYVLADYATGAVMGVPAHDERDQAFAQLHGLASKEVLKEGYLVDSAAFSGQSSEQARSSISGELQRTGKGRSVAMWNLKDWLLSRQRYWGAPIPIIHCQDCGVVPVPESDLPVLLPHIPLASKGNALASCEEFTTCNCPKCGKAARRETDTMDTFVDSSWYFLRYCDPHNSKAAADPSTLSWMPVDLYIGGIEHAVLHLLYARFINKCLNRIGLSPANEPFTKLITQGMVRGQTYVDPETGQFIKPDLVKLEDGKARHAETGKELNTAMEKMSKSKYNGVDPLTVIEEFGADTTRLYTLFRAPPEQDLDWDPQQITGQQRWLARLQTLALTAANPGPLESDADLPLIRYELHRTIKTVTEAIEVHCTFNTAIAALMTLSNVLAARKGAAASPVYQEAVASLFTMLSPLAPGTAAELLSIVGREVTTWPVFDPEALRSQLVEFAVQVNGKKQAIIQVEPDRMGDQDYILSLALSALGRPREQFSKVIHPPNRPIVSLVTAK